MTLNSGQEEVCFEASFNNFSTSATNAHIHVGPAGTPGPVVVPLHTAAAPFTGTSGSVANCVPANRELIKAIRQNPENYYVNIHSVGRPAGNVRGQLAPTQGSTVNQF
jgi:hypothetical protein